MTHITVQNKRLPLREKAKNKKGKTKKKKTWSAEQRRTRLDWLETAPQYDNTLRFCSLNAVAFHFVLSLSFLVCALYCAFFGWVVNTVYLMFSYWSLQSCFCCVHYTRGIYLFIPLPAEVKNGSVSM